MSHGLIAATRAHAAALAAIHATAFPLDGRWSEDVMTLQLASPGASGWIDASGGMILTRVAADEAEVLTLAVDPAVRRSGVARRLLGLAMATAAERGAVTIVLEANVANTAALGLYSSAGFVQVGRRPGYYAGGEDAVILRAPLSG